MAESASAADGEREKHFLCPIRDFAAEKSHGEWRVSDLEWRLDDLRAAASDLKRRLDDLRAAAELHATKRAEEAAEVEMSGSQEQAAIVAASIQAFEATNSHLYEEISKTGSDLEALKSKRDSARDEFISQMYELKAKIRQFQQMVSLELAEEKFFGLPSAGEHVRDKDKIESEGILKGLVDKVSSIDAEVHVLEEEYHKELLDHDKDLANIQGPFIESVMGDSESCRRDKIISQIHEMNAKIRQFQQMVSLELAEEKCSGLPSAEGQHVGDEDEIMEMEGILKILVDTVSKINAEVHVLEGECKKDLLDHDKVCEDLADIQAKRALMEAVMGEMKHLQELRQQTADMEKVYAAHGKGLQRRHTCPSCGINMVGLEGVGLHPKSSSSSMKEHDSSTSHLTICRDVVGKRGGSEDFGFLVSMGKHGSSSDSDTSDDYDSSDSSSPGVISRRHFYFPPPRSTVAAALPHCTPWQQHFSTALPGCSSPSKELPPLPPLPQFEVTQVQDSLSSGSSDDTSEVVSTSSSCKSGGDIENLEDLYAFGQPAWESLVAPVMGLALDEEEEELMMEATVLLGSDHKARKIIAEFDDAESSLAQVQVILGQQEVAIRTLPTSRDFLLNLPLSFLCKEKKGINCPICKSGFISKKRCARLPCSHFFHVHCILEWLLRANTCPACRRAFPSTDNNG